MFLFFYLIFFFLGGGIHCLQIQLDFFVLGGLGLGQVPLCETMHVFKTQEQDYVKEHHIRLSNKMNE